MRIRNIPGRSQIGPVPDVCVSEDQRLMCMGRGVLQWARHLSEFAPEIEGMDTVFVNGGTGVVHAQPEDTDVSIGRPIAFHPEITPPPPSD